MDILGQSALLVAITSIGLGIATLGRNVRNKLYLWFAALSVLVSGWAFSFFLATALELEWFYQLHLFFNVWLAPVALAFIRVMVRMQDGFSRRLLAISWFAAILLSIALLLNLESLSFVLQLIYFAPVPIVIQIVRLMLIDRKLRLGHKLTPKTPTVGFAKRNSIYLGALLILSTSVMDHVPFVGKEIPAFGNVALTVYLFFISQAISQQRLLNFSALLSRFLVLTAIALTLTGVYSVLILWLEYSPSLIFLNSFIVSFLILMLLDPLRSLVRFFTQRLLTQEHRRLEQTLREAQRKLTGIVDTGALFTAILQTVEQTIQPLWAGLFVMRTDGTKYRRVRTLGGDQPESLKEGEVVIREVLANHSLLHYCEGLHKKGELPIVLDQIIENEIDRSASRTQRESLAALVQGLRALGCNLIIPLIESGQILGFVAMHAPAPPDPWGNNWGLLPIIYPYFEQAAQTLRNMEVYVRRREKERLATIGEMAAGLAHEIRNPLGAIKGAAQFLDPSADRPESKFLRVIIEEVDRLNRVVTQFLDYSKPHAADFNPVDLRGLAEKTVEFLRPTAREGLRLEFFSSATDTRVMGSAEQLQQVLMNLIQNSFKALEGRPDAQVRVSVEMGGNGEEKQVFLVVEDNGIGIRREQMDKLFIPFFTTSPSGTGLGLSICQKIVEAHRGRIEVTSEEGRFTRFTVVLPHAPEQTA